jgi:hypothetical protein
VLSLCRVTIGISPAAAQMSLRACSTKAGGLLLAAHCSPTTLNLLADPQRQWSSTPSCAPSSIGLNVEPTARLQLDLYQRKPGQENLPQGAPKPEKFLAVLRQRMPRSSTPPAALKSA